jgi:hypothetical protein
MTIAQLVKKHRGQLTAFNRAYVARRRAIILAQKKHLAARKRAEKPHNSRTRKSIKGSKSIYKLLLKPLLNSKSKL